MRRGGPEELIRGNALKTRRAVENDAGGVRCIALRTALHRAADRAAQPDGRRTAA